MPEETHDNGSASSEQELHEQLAAADEHKISISSEELSQGLGDRIKSIDASFHQQHLQGLAISLGNLWLSFAMMAGAAGVLSLAMANPIVGVVIGAILGTVLYATVSYVLGLRIDLALERKVMGIRRAAALGAERVKIDDPQLVRSALGEVLCEWMHGAILLRRLKETSFWYRWIVAAQMIISLAAIAAFASLSTFSVDTTSVIVGVAVLLTIAHGWREIQASHLRGHTCAISDGLDPTEALTDRLVSLLEEVRALRRQRHID